MIAAPPIETFTDEITFQLDRNQAEVARWVLEGRSRVTACLGVRGGGKSGLVRAMIFMLATSAKRQIIYASQSNKNSFEQFTKLEADPTVQAYASAGAADEKPFVQTPHPTVKWATGSDTTFWAMEKFTGKLGGHPNILIIDEAQAIPYSVFSKVLWPMTVRPGKPCRVLIFGSTPETDGHWFWKLLEKGEIFPNDQDVKTFKFTKETCLAFRGARGRRLLAETRSSMAERDFESEYDLKPGGRGDHYFKKDAIRKCVAAYQPPEEALLRQGTVMVLDPSLGTHDPCAYMIMSLKGHIIKSESIRLGTADIDMVDEIIRVAKEWKSLVVVESNSLPRDIFIGTLKKLVPYNVRDIALRAEGLDQTQGKAALCKQAAWYLERGMISINPACSRLITQLGNIRDYKTPTGKLQIRAPDNEHDDEGLNLVLAVEALRLKWKPQLNTMANPAMNLI